METSTKETTAQDVCNEVDADLDSGPTLVTLFARLALKVDQVVEDGHKKSLALRKINTARQCCLE